MGSERSAEYPGFYGVLDIGECGSACKKDPVGGVIGVQEGPLISMV